MGGAEGVRHFACDLQGILNGKLFLPVQPIPEGFALDVGHDVIKETASFPRVVKRQDMRVMQLGGDLDLTQKPFGAEGRSQLGSQHLHRDLTMEFQILGEVHRRHAAGAQLTLDPVPI